MTNYFITHPQTHIVPILITIPNISTTSIAITNDNIIIYLILVELQIPSTLNMNSKNFGRSANDFGELRFFIGFNSSTKPFIIPMNAKW